MRYCIIGKNFTGDWFDVYNPVDDDLQIVSGSLNMKLGNPGTLTIRIPPTNSAANNNLMICGQTLLEVYEPDLNDISNAIRVIWKGIISKVSRTDFNTGEITITAVGVIKVLDHKYWDADSLQRRIDNGEPIKNIIIYSLEHINNPKWNRGIIYTYGEPSSNSLNKKIWSSSLSLYKDSISVGDYSTSESVLSSIFSASGLTYTEHDLVYYCHRTQRSRYLFMVDELDDLDSGDAIHNEYENFYNVVGELEAGINIVSMSETISDEHTYSEILPKGKVKDNGSKSRYGYGGAANGVNWDGFKIYDSEAQSKFGEREIFLHYDSLTDGTEIYNAGLADADKLGKYDYEINVNGFSKSVTSGSIIANEIYLPGQKIKIIDFYGNERELMLNEITLDILNKSTNSYKFSTFQISMSSLVAQVYRSMKRNSNNTTWAIDQINSIRNAALASADL